MRKSGLHKQISSIFDGVPVPSNSTLTEESESSEEMTGLRTEDDPQSDTHEATAPKSSGPSLVQRMTADPSDALESDPIPVLQVGRPMPLSKSKATSKSTMGPGLSTRIKKMVFGSHSSLDPHQKKTATLVGILSLVFGVVMFVSLGGVGKTHPADADAASGDHPSQSQATKKTAQQWKNPNPLPQNLRNATSPKVIRSDAQQEGTSAETGAMVVKGIVFSKNKPSAIINNQILSEGQIFNGVTIVKITKETVEFEANEKRWTQLVQR
ncbi:MAG: hypothetical protein B6I25_02065 [Planctomycetales bacterium 4572_13]|nr:MAG: hypothetical protein B6I25_02065 [Planctomycetales bacterium 4572_13]